MKSKTLTSVVRVFSLLLLVSATCVLAEDRRQVHFSGLLNDYVPKTPTIKNSPYEMHGQWSMDLRLERGNRRLLRGYDHVRFWYNSVYRNPAQRS
jgi:hypothetical protein